MALDRLKREAGTEAELLSRLENIRNTFLGILQSYGEERRDGESMSSFLYKYFPKNFLFPGSTTVCLKGKLNDIEVTVDLEARGASKEKIKSQDKVDYPLGITVKMGGQEESYTLEPELGFSGFSRGGDSGDSDEFSDHLACLELEQLTSLITAGELQVVRE